MGTDYADIHSAYKNSQSLTDVLLLGHHRFGLLIIALFILAAVYLLSLSLTRQAAIFMVAQLIIGVLLFTRTQDLGVHHYYLMIPTMIAVIATAGVSIYGKAPWGSPRSLLIALYVVVMLGNCWLVFSPASANVFGASAILFSSERHYPLVRSDLRELRDLMVHLDDTTKSREGSIYVLASSYTLNDDILAHIDLGRCGVCKRLKGTAHVDKRDGLSTDSVEAQWFVVAEPIQYHLRPEDQRVIGILAEDVLAGTGIGACYRKVEPPFHLDGGVTAWIYERKQAPGNGVLREFWGRFAKLYPERRNMFPRDGPPTAP